MEPRISMVNLLVEDLSTSRAFYAAMGWQPFFSVDETCFYDVGGQVFGLTTRAHMAQELGCPPEVLVPGGMTLAHNVVDQATVDAVLASARRAGATVHDAVGRDWGGYSGYFADPDGHLWEVAWNPHWPILEDGRLRLG